MIVYILYPLSFQIRPLHIEQEQPDDKEDKSCLLVIISSYVK